MHVVFRVDASAQIGFGHVMRCASLALMLKQQGVDVTFICRELRGHYCIWLEEQNYNVYRLAAPINLDLTNNPNKLYSDWLGVPINQEIEETSIALQKIGYIDWLVVDHYALDAVWESAMRTFCHRIMAIDDLANRMHDTDILLDQNLQQQTGRYTELVPTSCTLLLGPKFSLLRPEFSKIRSSIAPRDGFVRKILVFLGGADSRNVTGTVLNVLSKMQMQNITIDVVLTSGSPHLNKINALCDGMPNCKLHIQSSNMAELMANADFMIGGSGGATWERCCLGLPSLLICIAENQRNTAIQASRRRVAIYVGDDKSLSSHKLRLFLERLLCRTKLLRSIAKRAFTLVDGEGSSRICEILTLSRSSKLQARHATLKDENLLFKWVNDPIARINAFISEPITSETHHDWFLDKLKNTNSCHLFIIESKNQIPVGQVRFEFVNNIWRIDFSIASIFRGKGIGSVALRVALERMNIEEPGASVFAQVKTGNRSSQRVFEQLGFKIKGKSESIIEYQKLKINLS